MADSGTWDVRRILEWTTSFFKRKDVEPARLSAELILAHVLQQPRIKLYMNYERPLSEAELSQCRDLVKRASEQEPIAYLTGRAHFFNLEFDVTRDVLIPRPDTETLVENVLQLVRNQGGFEAPRVLDLCTGSGCIAAAIGHHLKSSVVIATDISEAAVAVARKNVERLNLTGRVVVEHGDLFEPLDTMVDVQPFNLVVSNPPYIATADMETLDRSVKDYEPHLALNGGPDGLTIHRRILEQAPGRLVAGGRVYLEIAFNQGELALQVANEYPAFDEAKLLKDFGGHDRVLTLRKK